MMLLQSSHHLYTLRLHQTVGQPSKPRSQINHTREAASYVRARAVPCVQRTHATNTPESSASALNVLTTGTVLYPVYVPVQLYRYRYFTGTLYSSVWNLILFTPCDETVSRPVER